jgi:hypothetical protein
MYIGGGGGSVFFGQNGHNPTVFLNAEGGEWGSVQMRRGGGWSRKYD